MIRSTKRGSLLVAAIGIGLVLLLAAGFFYVQYQTLRREKIASGLPVVKRTITAGVPRYQLPQADASPDSEVPLDQPAEEDPAVQQTFAADAPDTVAPVEPRSDLDGNGPANARQVGAVEVTVTRHFNIGRIEGLGAVALLLVLLLLMAVPKRDQ